MTTPSSKAGPDSSATTHVIVAGAGPAGLLTALLLLERNKSLQDGQKKYRVTLLESRDDLGELSQTELSKHRSWMLGLAGHGLEALRELPELYNDYIEGIGIRLKSLSIFLGSKELKSVVGDEGDDNEGYIVDRNYIVAALARFMKDKYANEPLLERLYGNKVVYVDGEGQRVLTRDAGDGTESYLDYDLLIGADGVRSAVREALIKRHYDIEFDVGDIFQCFKAVHIQRPASLDAASMHLLPSCLPKMQGIALPETGDMLNLSMGVPRHLFDELPQELKSSDPKIVAAYFQKNFKAFELADYDDLGQQWVDCRWNRTGQVHCNRYHSVPCNILIMGDAAHATSPSIGMGMNTALRDAQALYHLLSEYNDNIEEILPAFSECRVKEGNSLTDLAMHLNCFSDFHQMLETVHMISRSILANYLPTNWVSQHPQAMIGNPKYNLAEVYNLANSMGIIQKHRAINNRTRRDYFEKQTGMVVLEKKTSWMAGATKVASVAVVAAAVYYKVARS